MYFKYPIQLLVFPLQHRIET